MMSPLSSCIYLLSLSMALKSLLKVEMVSESREGIMKRAQAVARTPGSDPGSNTNWLCLHLSGPWFSHLDICNK